MQWEEYAWEILVAAALVPLVAFAIKTIMSAVKTTTTEISIRVSDEVLNAGARMGLLHVRDGRDEVSDKGPLLNQIHWFERVGEERNLRATVRHSKLLGFQFKCFAEYGDIGFDRVKEALEKEGYLEITRRETRRAKGAWFILPDYPTCKTADGFTNNFCYPE